MAKLIFWLKRNFRGKNKICKGVCMTCPYFDRCVDDPEFDD